MSMIGAAALAAIVLVSPENGARVPTLPPAQKAVLAQATKEEIAKVRKILLEG